MSAAHTPGPVLMREARRACEAVAEGAPFTPIVFERYEFIGGERGIRLGRPIDCGGGSGIDWTHRATIAKALGSAS